MTRNLLEIVDLQISFRTRSDIVSAVNGVNLDIAPGQVVAVVGESGSGKSATALAVPRLHGPEATVRGQIGIDGRDVYELGAEELRHARGELVGIVPQDPQASFHPMISIGAQLRRVFRAHRRSSWRRAQIAAEEALSAVGFDDPRRVAGSLPHQLSGGMRQRAAFASATLLSPSVIIADEPTTALDSTIQRQILSLLRNFADVNESAVLLITHDLGVANLVADRIDVMYGGVIVESGPTRRVLADPAMPYTKALLASSVRLEASTRHRLAAIPGVPGVLREPPGACVFMDRCEIAMQSCARGVPPLTPVDGGGHARCWVLTDSDRDQELP